MNRKSPHRNLMREKHREVALRGVLHADHLVTHDLSPVRAVVVGLHLGGPEDGLFENSRECLRRHRKGTTGIGHLCKCLSA